MRKTSLVIAAIAGFLALPALAQTPPPDGTPTRVRGTIEKLDGKALTVKARDGQTVTITLADNFTVLALVKKTAADIKQNDFIASTALKGADGKLHSVELRIFPETGRPAEGQFPWDAIPDSTMTNAPVTGIVTMGSAHTVKVSVKGTESEIIVDPDSPVFGYVQGDAGLLKPGAAVFVGALKKPDGTMTAARVTAEKDGVKPSF